MHDITEFPLSELEADRAASLADIRLCQTALAKNITTYRNGESVQQRLDTNQRIVEIIDAEIKRRGV